MESSAIFFVPDSVFQSNYLFLNDLERLDILTLNLTHLFSDTSWRAAPIFFSPDSVFQPNSPCLKEIELSDISAQNVDLLLLLIHHGKARHEGLGAGG
jgi:hypothetical protein